MRQLKITKSITNRESAALEKYLQEIGKEEMISAEEEVELAQRIKHGDQKALERLTKANLRFVVSVAKQYQNQGLSLPDLINEGNLGLLKAAERFDETRGFKFISYAVWWIRQSILQAISEQSRIVRLPLNQVGSVNKITREINRFEQENERRPSLEEIAEKIDLPEDKIDEAMNINGHHVSVDAPFVDGEDNSLLDVMPNENSPMADTTLVEESLRAEIQEALTMLSDRERNVIEASYGINRPELTMEEIGVKFGLTRERVRQKAIKTYREYLERYALEQVMTLVVSDPNLQSQPVKELRRLATNDANKDVMRAVPLPETFDELLKRYRQLEKDWFERVTHGLDKDNDRGRKIFDDYDDAHPVDRGFTEWEKNRVEDKLRRLASIVKTAKAE